MPDPAEAPQEMGPLGLVAGHQTLLRHDLKLLQRRGVPGRAAAGELLMDVLDGARATAPEHAQDRQLGVGRSGVSGMEREYTKVFVFINGNFS